MQREQILKRLKQEPSNQVPSKKINIPDDLMKLLKHDGFHPLRRDLEDDEELLQRDFDAKFEEFFEREYDDFLAERDAFDDDLDYY